MTQHLRGWPQHPRHRPWLEQLLHFEIFCFSFGKSSNKRTDLCRVQSLSINLRPFSPAVRAFITALCRQVLGDVGVQCGHQALLAEPHSRLWRELVWLELAEGPPMGILREFLMGFGCMGQRRWSLFGVLPRVVPQRIIVDVALERAEGRKKERGQYCFVIIVVPGSGLTLSALPTQKTITGTHNANVDCKPQTVKCASKRHYHFRAKTQFIKLLKSKRKRLERE